MNPPRPSSLGRVQSLPPGHMPPPTPRRRMRRGVVEKDDLDLVFGRFERIEGGHMGFADFGQLVADLRLGLREAEVKHLFLHLAEDATINKTALQTCDDETQHRRLSRARTWAPGNLQRTPTEDARINVDQFLAGIRRHRFLRRIVSHYAFPDLDAWAPPATYDWTKSTQDNYGVPITEGFVGALAHLRKALDPAWHGNYNPARQRWQDAAVHRVALVGGEDQAGPTTKPWLVYTCGPMGAGKGWVMNWMSQRDIFPLRRVVHVDPDRFKRLMPEWPAYVQLNEKNAGTLCHTESGTMAELAQALAMDQRCHVWVDGSLRDFDWYAPKIAALRKQFPHYRIALFYIHAPEATVRRRVSARAKRCGEEQRDIPEDVLAASLAAPALTLRALTPHVDFIARIRNEEGDPELEALETVDASGSWEAISKRFGGSFTSGLPAATSALSLASSNGFDDDPGPPTPLGTPQRTPASPRAEVAALKLQAENDRRTIAGLRASLRAAEEKLVELVRVNGTH